LNKDLEFTYKIFIKESDNNLIIKSIRFELFTSNANVLYFEAVFKSEQEKIIQVRHWQPNILNFEYKKNLKIGVGQFYDYCFETVKSQEDIDIDLVNLKFSLGEDTTNKSVQFSSIN
jgi:hypothetical protein